MPQPPVDTKLFSQLLFLELPFSSLLTERSEDAVLLQARQLRTSEFMRTKKRKINSPCKVDK